MSETLIPSRFLVRGGTASAVAALNEIPKFRELVFETDTRKFKLGDGSTAYNSLNYVVTDATITTTDVTTNNATTSKHGFLKKLSNNANEYMDGTGNWSAPSGAIGDQASVTYTEGAAPSTPASGKVITYAKTDGLMYSKDDAGTETLMSGGAGGGGGYSEGTSFPGGPSTNDKFFRTDLGWLCYYDGTRWLTDFEIALPALANIGQTGSGTAFGVYWYHALRQDYGLYLTKWSATTYVPTTNDGTKYWTCRLEWLTDANVATSLVSFTTASDTASRFTFHEQAINAVLSSSARALASTNSVKTSTPGNVLLLPTVYARLIVT